MWISDREGMLKAMNKATESWSDKELMQLEAIFDGPALKEASEAVLALAAAGKLHDVKKEEEGAISIKEV